MTEECMSMIKLDAAEQPTFGGQYGPCGKTATVFKSILYDNIAIRVHTCSDCDDIMREAESKTARLS